jgi:hypothetical protein
VHLFSCGRVYVPSSPWRCRGFVRWGSSTKGVEVLEWGSISGLRGAPLVLTVDTIASVFTAIVG